MTVYQPDSERNIWATETMSRKRTELTKMADMEQLAKKAEEGAQKGEQRNVYKITKLICGKYRGSTNGPIQD